MLLFFLSLFSVPRNPEAPAPAVERHASFRAAPQGGTASTRREADAEIFLLAKH
jgi:hypothetical protein